MKLKFQNAWTDGLPSADAARSPGLGSGDYRQVRRAHAAGTATGARAALEGMRPWGQGLPSQRRVIRGGGAQKFSLKNVIRLLKDGRSSVD